MPRKRKHTTSARSLLSCDIDHRLRLDIYGFRVGLILDLRSCHQLFLRVYAKVAKQLERFVGNEGRDRVYHAL